MSAMNMVVWLTLTANAGGVADSDGDGWPDLDEEHLCGASAPVSCTGTVDGDLDNDDYDGDGLPNYLDNDDDDDGVPTWAELLAFADPLALDSDADGLTDGEEWLNVLDLASIGAVAWVDLAPCGDPNDIASDARPVTTGKVLSDPWDRDCDGTINALDSDDDGDGLPTDGAGHEGRADVDCLPGTGIVVGDGLPSWLDLDSDAHTMLVPGATHPSCVAVPCALTTDDQETGTTDQDADGVPDAFDCTDDSPNLDSDLDGISDQVEDLTCPVDPTERLLACALPAASIGACALMPDADCDGVFDCIEAGVPCPGDAGWVPGGAIVLTDPYALPDSDGDGAFDPFDPDDDEDGLLTADELAFTCLSGDVLTPSSAVAFDVVQVDGLLDAFRYVCANGDVLRPWEGPDVDGDGRVDHLDADPLDGPLADPDGDGLTNGQELILQTSPTNADSDGDGVPDDVEVGRSAVPREHRR
jgi:hypothetical protein